MNYIGFVFYAITGALVCTLNVRAQRVEGVPGVDYPNYPTIPKTSFKCSEQKYIPGFYADLETDCQVFHFCFKHRSESFLCPTGTTFNQPILACDSWYNSNCSLAPLYYAVNAGPGIENAGRNIPMLLKLRNNAPESVSTLATINVFEKISSLYEEGSEQEILSAAAKKIASSEVVEIEDSSSEHPKNESQIVPDEVLAGPGFSAEGISLFGENKVEDGLPSAGHVESKNKSENNGDKAIKFENQPNLEQVETDLVYDPVTDGYYRENLQSDAEWQDEPEEQNDQFQNFYDYDSYNQMQQNEVSEPFQNRYVEEQYEEASEYQNVQPEDSPEYFGIDRSQSDLDKMSEFSKRLLHTSRVPKRSRHKPAYIVIDHQRVGLRYPSRFETAPEPDVETSESPLEETISMDDLVELNTELPDTYSLDGESYEEFGNAENTEENAGLDESESYPETDDSEAEKYYEQEMLDETGQYQNDPSAFEDYPVEDNFKVDPSMYSELDSSQDEYQSGGTAESDSNYSVQENDESYPNERIIVYDDSGDSEAMKYYKQEQYMRMLETSQYQNDQSAFDYPEDNFQGVDPSMYSELDSSQDEYKSGGIAESDSSDSVEENDESYPNKRIVYDSGDSEAKYYKQEQYMRMLDQTGQYQNDQPAFEYPEQGNFQVDPSMYSELDSSQDEYQSGGITKSYSSDSVEENDESYPNERIIVYDDSDDPEIPSNIHGRNFAPDLSEEEESVAIPDETDPSELKDAVSDLSPDTEYESVNVPGSQNWEYAYSKTSEIPVKDSDDNIYVYDDSGDNEQRFEEMQSDSTTDQTYTSEEMAQSGYDESYAVSEEMAQNQYVYSGQSDGIEYSQFQDPEYDEAQKYIPVSYYQYASENGEPLSQYENPDYYRIPQGSLPEGRSISEYEESLNGPENSFQYGVFGESSAYNSQPDIKPANYVTYYQTPDGKVYSNEGVEIQNESILGNGDESAAVYESEISYERYPEEQPDSLPEGHSISEFEDGLNGPENSFQYGVFRESSAYNSQQDIQPPNYVTDYYQTSDGKVYSNEGVEIQNESILGDDESAAAYESEMSYERYPGEQPDSWNKYDTEESVHVNVDATESSLEVETGANVTGSIHGDVDSEDLDEDSDLDESESGLVKDFGSNESDDTFYVIDEENETVDDTWNVEEYLEFPNSNAGEATVETVAEDIVLNKDGQIVESQDGSESGPDFVSVKTHGGKDKADLSIKDLETNAAATFDSKNPEDSWSEQTFGVENEKSDTLALERLVSHKTKAPQSEDFVSPTETQFLNSMNFPKSMDFAPYNFGPNMGSQFGMPHSSNAAPSAKDVSIGTGKSGVSPLSKLSSLQEKVRSMKRGGKFGLFKQYINSMKNQN